MTESYLIESAFQLFAIMMVNLMLSGDNAIIIAMACRNLAPIHQRKAILWGTGGAVVLRVVLTLVAAYLLTIPYLQFIGGALLVWIAAKLLVDDAKESKVAENSSFAGAIKTIIVADLVMSLDNTLAIAAIAQGHMWLLMVGLVMSIPIVVFGSTLLIKVMEKFPVVIYIGAGLIAWAAGIMIRSDGVIGPFFAVLGPKWILPAIITASVIAIGFFWKKKAMALRASSAQ